MEFRTLKYFLTVAREENITRAAALLHLTQPTLSRQLMQLEEELGVKLFRRSQHHIVLTEAGMLLRRRAQEIVELAEKTARELRPAEEVTGRISIGSGDLRSMTYLAKLLAAFHRQHPRVQYEIYSGDSDGIKERIEQGLLDMGLLLEPVDTSRYQILRLPVRESWGVLVPEDSPPGPAGGGDARGPGGQPPDPDHPGADAPGNDPLVRPLRRPDPGGGQRQPALQPDPAGPGGAGDLSGDPAGLRL